MTDPRHPQGPPGPPTTEPPAPQDARAKAIELVDGEWHRLHPATPLLRGGLALIIFLGILLSTFRDRLIGLFVPDELAGDWNEDPFGDFVVDQLLWVGLGVIALVLVGLAGRGGTLRAIAAWLMLVGTVLFCGSIYARAFGAPAGIVSIAPYGGVAFMAAWLAFAASPWLKDRRS